MSFYQPQKFSDRKLIVCDNCHSKNSFKDSLIERPWSGEEAAIEGVLICPDCGNEKHCYFMSEKLMLARDVSTRTVKALSLRRTQENFDMVRDIKEKYKNLFDEEQARLSRLLGKENERTT